MEVALIGMARALPLGQVATQLEMSREALRERLADLGRRMILQA
jgi:hypothetical protein